MSHSCTLSGLAPLALVLALAVPASAGDAAARKVLGFSPDGTLALDDATPMVLQPDTRLPKSRRCATEYGIAEAWLHEAPDGTQALAALIETADAHEFHAGPNRRFMAVTRRLPPSR